MRDAEGLPLAVASGLVSYNKRDLETQGGEWIIVALGECRGLRIDRATGRCSSDRLSSWDSTFEEGIGNGASRI